MAAPHSICSPDPNDPGSCLLMVKAVPGASRDQIVGVMEFPEGPRLKVKTSAPAESGKANKAIAKLLAKALGVATKDVALVSAPSNPHKTFGVIGVNSADAESRIDAALR